MTYNISVDWMEDEVDRLREDQVDRTARSRTKTIKIKHRVTGDVIFESETADTVEEAVEDAGCESIDLSWADLRGLNLSWRNLSWMNLSNCDLTDTLMFETDLRLSDLRGAILSGVNMSGADTQGTKF